MLDEAEDNILVDVARHGRGGGCPGKHPESRRQTHHYFSQMIQVFRAKVELR